MSLTDAQLAGLWRRQLQVYDDLVFGNIIRQRERHAARERTWTRRIRRRLRWWPDVWYAIVWRFWHTLPRLAQRFNEREREREQCAGRAPAAVTFADLADARHLLSIPRFHPSGALCEEHFRHSDPLDEFYVGRPETDFARVRSEIDGEFT